MFESQHQFERFMCCLPAIFLYPMTSKVCWNRNGWLGSDIWLNNYWHRGQLKLELWSWKQQRRQFVIQGKIKKGERHGTTRWCFQTFPIPGLAWSEKRVVSNILFNPENWGDEPIWRAYFSNGLVQPPTRKQLDRRPLRHICWLDSFFWEDYTEARTNIPWN